jgi:hypothetical protein
VALAALIIAIEDDDAAKEPRHLFGMPILEYQARQAAAAGARHIIIHAERVPANLVGALDQLKSDGMTVGLVRTAREAADAVHPDELVLIFSGPVLADMPFLKEQCNAARATIFTRPLVPNVAGQELIDAEHAWAGVALLPGGLLRHTATMLGDWSLAPTLLRLGVQAGVKRLSLTGDFDQKIFIASTAPGLADKTSALWHDRLSRVFARNLSKIPYRPSAIAFLPLILLVLTLALAAISWNIAALILFAVMAIPATAVGLLLDASLNQSRWPTLYEAARPWVGRILFVLASFAAMAAGSGWEALVLALWVTWLLAMAPTQDPPFYFGETTTSALIAGGLLTGFPISGFCLALAHGLLSTLRLRFSSIA